MKRKRITKSDRQWCYTLLKLIINAAKNNRSFDSRRPKHGKSKKSDECSIADKFPQLINLFLKSKSANIKENMEDILRNFEQLNGPENLKFKDAGSSPSEKVACAQNSKGSGDANSRSCYNPHLSSNKCFEMKTGIEMNILKNHNFQKHMNSNSKSKENMGFPDHLPEYLSMQVLTARLNKLKNLSPSTDSNELQSDSVKIGNVNLTKSLGPKRQRSNNPYKLTKESVRKIPFGFLNEIKDVVPGGVDDIIDRHTRRKISSRSSDHSEEAEVTCNNLTTHAMERNRPEAVAKVQNTGKTRHKPYEDKNSSVVKTKIIMNNRDITSSLGENYKRIFLALQADNRTERTQIPKREQRNELVYEKCMDDSLDNLQNIVQGKTHLIKADVDGNLTKVLNKNYYLERITLPEVKRKIFKHSQSNKKSINNYVDLTHLTPNVTKVKKKLQTERNSMMNHGGCECYLKKMHEQREKYLNSLGMTGAFDMFPKNSCYC